MQLLIANWKCQGNLESLHALNEWVQSHSRAKTHLVVLLPSAYMGFWHNLSWPSWVHLGAQAVFHKGGAYTGAINIDMLKEVGCQYVCVGHSERRTVFSESPQVCVQQYCVVANAGLKPILCVGEPAGSDLDEDMRVSLVYSQIEQLINDKDFKNIKKHDSIIAYEPGWAIGTGKTPSIQSLESFYRLLEAKITQASLVDVNRLAWCYGGSVGEVNVSSFAQAKNINGLLVGRASFNKKVMQRLLV